MRCARFDRVFVLSALLAAGVGAEQSREAGENADLAAVRLATLEQPASFDAWMYRLAIESMSAAVEASAAGDADPQAAGERRSREILTAWKTARPRDAGPYLAEIYRQADSPARRAQVLALAERFPEDPVALEHALRIRTDRGELEDVARALESFVDAHPEVARGYALLAAHYERNGNRPAAHEVAQEWMTRVPEDAAAFSAWLRTGLGELSTAALEGAVARLLPALLEKPLTSETLQLCQTLSERQEPGVATAGQACIEQVAERAANPEVRRAAARTLLSLAAKGGDWERAVAGLETLPPDERLAASWSLASQLRLPQDCPRLVALCERLSILKGESRDVATEVAGFLHRCSDVFEARELYVRLFASARAERLPQLVFAWRAQVNGRLVHDLPLDRLLPVLRRRWAEAPGDPGIAEALDLVYEAAGLRAERLELLRSEGAQGRWPRNALRLIELAEEVAGEDPDLAVEWLRGALARSPGDSRVFRALAELLLLLDRTDEVQTLAERGLASDDAFFRGSAHWTLARLAVRKGELQPALDHYQQAIDAGGAVREIADELLYVLALAERVDQIPARAEALCAGGGLRDSGQSPEACVAAALARSGQVPQSAKYLAGALAKAPQKPEVLDELARVLAASGDTAGAERVLRQRIDLDPANEGGWAELGLVLLQAEDLDAHYRVLTEAERVLGAPSLLLRYQHAKLQLSKGDARGAIETLLAMKKLRPELNYYDDLLREAYGRLGAQP